MRQNIAMQIDPSIFEQIEGVSMGSAEGALRGKGCKLIRNRDGWVDWVGFGQEHISVVCVASRLLPNALHSHE